MVAIGGDVRRCQNTNSDTIEFAVSATSGGGATSLPPTKRCKPTANRQLSTNN
jgi:hypothetical protein